MRDQLFFGDPNDRDPVVEFLSETEALCTTCEKIISVGYDNRSGFDFDTETCIDCQNTVECFNCGDKFNLLDDDSIHYDRENNICPECGDGRCHA
jgi:hypothetical protein